MHLHSDLSQVSRDTKKTLRKNGLSFSRLLFRNVFYVYASTLGTEEASEADDIFNEKAELHVFRDKVKTSHENEVREEKIPGKSIFLHISPFRHCNLNNRCLPRRSTMTQIAAIIVHPIPSILTTITARTSTRTCCSIRNFTQATQALISRRRT